MLPSYEGFTSPLRCYPKQSSGSCLTAMVFVDGRYLKTQELSLCFGDEATLRFRMPNNTEIPSDPEELMSLWERARKVWKAHLEPHGIKFHFSAWLSGNVFRPTEKRMDDMRGKEVESGYMFEVRTLSVDPATAGLDIPEGTPWEEWINHQTRAHQIAIHRYREDVKIFFDIRLSNWKREPVPA